jgi:hypothetical protein
MRSYEPAEFVSLLASDQLDEPMNLTVYGPVKADENDSSALFSRPRPMRAMAPHPDFLDRFDPAWRHRELQRSSASLCQDRARRAQ